MMDNFVNDSLGVAEKPANTARNFLCKSVQGTVLDLERRIRMIALEDRSTPKGFAAPRTTNNSLHVSRVSPLKEIKAAKPLGTSVFEYDALRVSQTAFGESRSAAKQSSGVGDSRLGGQNRNQSRQAVISTRAQNRQKL